jgi:PPK2 family polyphosphate:nucleotide phosphotransferase
MPHPTIEPEKLLQPFRVPPGKHIALSKDYDPGYVADFVSQEDAAAALNESIQSLAEFQDKLYAQETYALLLILQAMDAAGKDSVIKHVFTGLNPQGCEVHSFKVPSAEELAHDYLWRSVKALPARGYIGIFNRSYYEEVLVVRVHPELLEKEHLPSHAKGNALWARRFEEINHFERYLVDNGIVVLKCFLHLSKEEQRRRFLKRIEQPNKNWKFSTADVQERAYWDAYQQAYEDALNHTSTPEAPWYVIPADHKWFTRLSVATLMYYTLRGLKLAYPTVSEEHRQELLRAKAMLESERG